MKRIVVHNAAEAELTKAMRWYEKQRPGCGRELRIEIERAFEKISNDPGIGANYDDFHKFYRVKRYPYVVYYVEMTDFVWVAAISHGRRRPGYWRKRKP